MSKPSVIVIFGISGDLSQRKLLPALYHLLTHDLLSADTKIIGTSRRPLIKSELLAKVELCVLEDQKVCDPAGLQKINSSLEIIQFDTSVIDDYAQLGSMLDTFDIDHKLDRLFYLAVPPTAYAEIATFLGEQNLNDDRTRLLIEKPFGNDLSSAKDLIKSIGTYFNESQIYRIDHYLAKETAQNLLTFRTHNPIFTPLWSDEHIQSIHVRAAENIGVENRAAFYEQTGALRDVIQGHLLQLLAIVMMAQPADGTSTSIHASKEELLHSLLVVPDSAVRGQYQGYREEVGSPDSSVETYAKIELRSTLKNWQGTRIILETGKALNEKSTDITVQFKHPQEQRKNELRFRLQPDEGLSLGLVVKTPGFDNQMEDTHLDFSYKNAFKTQSGHPDAYERVIMDAVAGDQSLFASSNEVISSWQVVMPVLDAWSSDTSDLQFYPKGALGINK